MRVNPIHIAVLTGLLCGIVFCNDSGPKPILTHSTAVIGTFPSLLMRPGSVPLLPILIDTPTEIPSTPDQSTTIEPSLPTVNTSVSVDSSHSDLLAAAGIDPSQWASAEWLVDRESGWNPTAYNTEGACSLVQSLPCSKIPGDWTDPVTALTWGQSYVLARYGSWDAALAHSLAYNYY